MNSSENLERVAAPPPTAAPSDPAAIIEAWVARGAQNLDPVRFRFIEALARRSTAYGGEARRLLDDKLARLLAQYRDSLESAALAERNDECTAPSSSADDGNHPACETLTDLIDHIDRHASADGDESPARGGARPDTSPIRELKSLRYFGSTWSRLRAHRRLSESLAKAPENPGPINSHHLVHRALATMRDLSPEYLDHFMSYVDTLLWLEQASTPPAADRRPVRPHSSGTAAHRR
ncbi:MAG TPA: DUF2894 domain-containing protein [Burkholderiaceae bacterium]|nr:DUF2894 domain-containing protein [Burkholderiaceae bacterium]